MIRTLALLAISVVTLAGSALADDVLEGHARRGAVYQRIDLDGGTVRACAALCDEDRQCRAWVFNEPGLTGPDAQCALLSAALTPYRAPGQTTGLSTRLADAIETALVRPPTPREIKALEAADGPIGE